VKSGAPGCDVVLFFFRQAFRTFQLVDILENIYRSFMKTILFIDDNAQILDNLQEYFALEGYSILIANCGEAGIDLAQKAIPDLIICDILMQGMDGREVLRTILASPETERIPFIFSTSMSERNDRVNAMKLGISGYIVKPYTLESLLLMSRDVLSKPKIMGEVLVQVPLNQ
jgi:CheY-like chemotaxis protein